MRLEREELDKWTTADGVTVKVFGETDNSLTVEYEKDGQPHPVGFDCYYFLLERIAQLRPWAPDSVSRS